MLKLLPFATLSKDRDRFVEKRAGRSEQLVTGSAIGRRTNR